MQRPARFIPTLAGAALAALGGGVPSKAQTVAELAASCPQGLTVQQVDCRVTTYHRCSDGSLLALTYDAARGQPDAALFDGAGGPISSRTAEGTGILRVVETRDPASLLNAYRNGNGDFDLTLLVRDASGQEREARFTGWFTREEQMHKADGRQLISFATEQRLDGGGVAPTVLSVGSTYLDFFLGVPMDGSFTTSVGGQAMTSADHSPADFIFPGEDGYEATTPVVGCTSGRTGSAP